jgi:hypothetical protein
MSRHRVEITPDWPPGNGSVLIDGHDIANAVREARVVVVVPAGEAPRVELELGVVNITPLGATEAEVYISPETRDALIALGWTPPPEN